MLLKSLGILADSIRSCCFSTNSLCLINSASFISHGISPEPDIKSDINSIEVKHTRAHFQALAVSETILKLLLHFNFFLNFKINYFSLFYLHISCYARYPLNVINSSLKPFQIKKSKVKDNATCHKYTWTVGLGEINAALEIGTSSVVLATLHNS